MEIEAVEFIRAILEIIDATKYHRDGSREELAESIPPGAMMIINSYIDRRIEGKIHAAVYELISPQWENEPF